MFQAKKTTYKGPEADQPGNQGRLPMAWPRVHPGRVELVPLPGVSAPVLLSQGLWLGRAQGAGPGPGPGLRLARTLGRHRSWNAHRNGSPTA